MKRKTIYNTVILVILAILIFVSAMVFLYVLSKKKDLQPQLNAMNEVYEELETENKEIQIYLPEICYAAAGVTLEIYNSQVTDQCNDITRYNVLWSCDIGENLERKYSLTATEEMIGDHKLTISIYDNELNLLAEKACTLKVVDGKLSEEISIHEIRNIEEFSVADIKGDAVQIFLEADNIQIGENHKDDIAVMIDAIRAAGDMRPIYVTNAVYQEEPNLETFQLMAELSGELADYEGVYLIPVGISVDSEYNYEITDAIHPNEAGYAQIADMIFATVCGTMN